MKTKQQEKDFIDEIWKDVENFEGHYKVSNFGRVKSLKSGKEKILTPSLNGSGYEAVTLFKKSLRKNITVHKLVAIAFLNHKPNGHKLVVNHKDFNKQNNKLSNLEIVTQRQNSNKKHIISSSKFTGVTFNKRLSKWVANITIGTTSTHLGIFDNEIEASEYYEKAVKACILGLPIDKKKAVFKNKLRNIYLVPKINKWELMFTINNKRIYIGRFDTEEEAYTHQCLIEQQIKNGDTILLVRKEYSSPCKGVSWSNKYNVWTVRLTINGDRIRLGEYKEETFACRMYQTALNNKHLYLGDKKHFKETIKQKIKF